MSDILWTKAMVIDSDSKVSQQIWMERSCPYSS